MKRWIAVLSVLSLACVVSGSANMDMPKQGKEVQEGDAGLTAHAALYQALPLVQIEQAYTLTHYGAAAVIDSIEQPNAQGDLVPAEAPNLVSVTAGSVIRGAEWVPLAEGEVPPPRDYILKAKPGMVIRDAAEKTVVLEEGDRLLSSDVILKALVENTGSEPLWITFDAGRQVIVADPGDTVYVGPSNLIEKTHKKQCVCWCLVGNNKCMAVLAGINDAETCVDEEGEGCTCTAFPDEMGVLDKCAIRWVEQATDPGVG